MWVVVIYITVCCIIQTRTRSSASLCILAKFTGYNSRRKKTASLRDKFDNNITFKKNSAKLHLPSTTDLFVKDQNTGMQSEDHDKNQICKRSCSSPVTFVVHKS